MDGRKQNGGLDENSILSFYSHGTGTVGTSFHDAGGVATLVKELEKSLHTDCLTVTGKTVGENLKEADMPYNTDIIRTLDNPLNQKGIKDFVRITDSRMSGGGFGTQVSHVAPESAVGGPLAVVRDGDIIHHDVDNNLIELEISAAEMEARLQEVKTKEHKDIKRGFVRNFIDNVTQADEGCDLKYMQYVD